MKLRSAQKFWL